MSPDRRRLNSLLLACIVAFAAIFRLCYLNHHFERDPEGVSAYYGILARNYFRFDWSQTYGVPVESVGKTSDIVFYPNHPPLVPMLIAAVYGVIGYRGGYDSLPPDWALRLPAALFTLGDILLIYWLMRKRSDERVALLSAALFATMPISLYYGGFADCVGSQLIFFMILAVVAYLRFHATPNWKTLGWLCLSILPAALTDWPTFFIFPVIGLHFVFTQPRRRSRWLLAIAIFSIVLFTGLYFHGYVATRSWRWMDRILLRRTMSNLADSGETFGLWDWLVTCIWKRCALDHTSLILLLLLGWIIAQIPNRWREWNDADRFAGLLLGWALIHVIVGRQGVYVHDWWWWPLTPGAAIATALFIDRLLRRARVNAAWSIPLVVLFAARNTWTTVQRFAHPSQINLQGLDYTPYEFGQVARSSTAPDASVIFSETDRAPALWYYADRGIKRDVWEQKKFESELRDLGADLTFVSITQQCGAPPQVAIIPRAYASGAVVQQYLRYLGARYPSHDTPQFIVFDLRQTK